MEEEHVLEIVKILNACCYGLSIIIMTLLTAGVWTKNWRLLDIAAFMFLYLGIVLCCSVSYYSGGKVGIIVMTISFITYTLTVLVYLCIGLIYYVLKIFFTLPYVVFKTILLWGFKSTVGGEVSE